MPPACSRWRRLHTGRDELQYIFFFDELLDQSPRHENGLTLHVRAALAQIDSHDACEATELAREPPFTAQTRVLDRGHDHRGTENWRRRECKDDGDRRAHKCCDRNQQFVAPCDVP